MTKKAFSNRYLSLAFLMSLAAISFLVVCVCPVTAQNGSAYFYPGNLVVSRSVYDNNPNNVEVGMTLPPNCVLSTGSCVTAIVDGTYPFVFSNAPVDGSFGITSKLFLDQITPWGWRINWLEIPNSSQKGVPPAKNQMVTSFSSKSEVALNLSTDGKYLTFMGYLAPINALTYPIPILLGSSIRPIPSEKMSTASWPRSTPKQSCA